MTPAVETRSNRPEGWLLDVEEFGGDRHALGEFAEQFYCRAAREMCRMHGKGVLIVTIDRSAKTLSAEFNTMRSDDGSALVRQVRALVATYDPEHEVVLLYRDVVRGKEVAGIVTIIEQQ